MYLIKAISYLDNSKNYNNKNIKYSNRLKALKNFIIKKVLSEY